MQPIVVFDSNVLISGIGWKGKASEALELARSGTVAGLTCAEILNEVAEKLQSKAGLSAKDADDAVIDLLGFLQLIEVPGTLHAVVGDPDDDPIVECAVVGHASHIVTGDRRHLLPMKNYQGIAIITPAELLALVVP